MIEFNHILFGACLFITSYSLLLSRQITGKYLKKTHDLVHDTSASASNVTIASVVRNESRATTDSIIIADSSIASTRNNDSSPVDSETSGSHNNGSSVTPVAGSKFINASDVIQHEHQSRGTTDHHVANSSSHSAYGLNGSNHHHHTSELHTTSDQYLNSSLIDIMLPYMENEILTNLINDELVSSVIVGGTCKSFYVCIHTDKAFNCPRSVIINYISILYSKIWNEAILKDKLDLQCYIISDDFDDLISREEVLRQPTLTHLYSLLSNQSSIIDDRHSRHAVGLDDVRIINIYDSIAIKQLLIDYRSQGKVLVLDSFYEEQEADYPTYSKLSLGGTFDHLHYGHRKLLTLALLCCKEELVVGITSSMMLAKKSHQSIIHSFADRRRAVESFIKKLKPSLKTMLVELNDPFGPTITDPDIDAILVSSETIRGAFKINQIRREKGFRLLDILVTYRTDSVILSSSFIRGKLISNKRNE